MSGYSLSGFGCDGAEYRSRCSFAENCNVGSSACKKNSWGSWTSIISGLQKKKQVLKALFLGSMEIKSVESMWGMFHGVERGGVP